MGQEPHPSPAAAPPLCRAHFLTLADAVAASRPGDTILLEPTPLGRPHDAAGIVISHPLRLLGGDSAPGDCVLRCSVRGVPALIFTASAHLSNLTIEGDGLAGAVAHHAGRLQLEDCEVLCCARGLPHLAAPLVCMSAPASGPVDVNRAAAAAEVVESAGLNSGGPSVGLNECSEGLKSPEMVLPTLSQQNRYRQGPGAVAVAGCALEGGGSAVRLCGGATLRAVRVVYEAHKALFWFEVDAGESSRLDEGQAERGAAGAAAGSLLATSAAGPSWLGSRGAQGFDPRALQAQVEAMVAGAAAPLPPVAPPAPLSSGAADVEKKAQAWRAGHRATSIAPPRHAESRDHSE